MTVLAIENAEICNRSVWNLITLTHTPARSMLPAIIAVLTLASVRGNHASTKKICLMVYRPIVVSIIPINPKSTALH